MECLKDPSLDLFYLLFMLMTCAVFLINLSLFDLLMTQVFFMCRSDVQVLQDVFEQEILKLFKWFLYNMLV